MNNRTTFALLALLTAVGTLTMSTAYAQTYSSCIGCTPEEAKAMALDDLLGTIAAMILAVAIISIIAVSAKSRLSIIPRY
jgi:predicted secreted protein with PEFG-CTERM motif